MNRREFIKGCAAVVGSLALPVAVVGAPVRELVYHITACAGGVGSPVAGMSFMELAKIYTVLNVEFSCKGVVGQFNCGDVITIQHGESEGKDYRITSVVVEDMYEKKSKNKTRKKSSNNS